MGEPGSGVDPTEIPALVKALMFVVMVCTGGMTPLHLATLKPNGTAGWSLSVSCSQ
jgi:hypothetical protein